MSGRVAFSVNKHKTNVLNSALLVAFCPATLKLILGLVHITPLSRMLCYHPPSSWETVWPKGKGSIKGCMCEIRGTWLTRAVKGVMRRCDICPRFSHPNWLISLLGCPQVGLPISRTSCAFAILKETVSLLPVSWGFHWSAVPGHSIGLIGVVVILVIGYSRSQQTGLALHHHPNYASINLGSSYCIDQSGGFFCLFVFVLSHLKG